MSKECLQVLGILRWCGVKFVYCFFEQFSGLLEYIEDDVMMTCSHIYRNFIWQYHCLCIGCGSREAKIYRWTDCRNWYILYMLVEYRAWWRKSAMNHNLRIMQSGISNFDITKFNIFWEVLLVSEIEMNHLNHRNWQSNSRMILLILRNICGKAGESLWRKARGPVKW